MFCPNCGAQSNTNFCPNCGQNLQGVHSQPQNAHIIPEQQKSRIVCPRCQSVDVTASPRGFSFLGGCLGFLFIPFLGLLFGLIGSKKLVCQCRNCSYQWKRDP